jgi:hypothetical protein
MNANARVDEAVVVKCCVFGSLIFVVAYSLQDCD